MLLLLIIIASIYRVLTTCEYQSPLDVPNQLTLTETLWVLKLNTKAERLSNQRKLTDPARGGHRSESWVFWCSSNKSQLPWVLAVLHLGILTINLEFQSLSNTASHINT